jgi:hypothetical protein
MGNVDTIPSRSGSANGAADKWSLFLKVFSGEVLSLFEQKTVMRPLITVRSIAQGKSATFPLYGSLGTKFHKPGENIMDSTNSYVSEVKFAERVLNIDGQLISAAFVAEIDELLNHWDVRGPIAQQIGRELAYYFDKAAINTMIAAARTSSSPVTYKTSGGLDMVGGVLATQAASFNVEQFIALTYDAASLLDRKDVPEEDRFLLVNPANYWKIVNSGSSGVYVTSTDYSAGNANVAAGKIYQLAGFRIIKTPFIPAGLNMISDTDTNTTGTQISANYQTLSGLGTSASMPNHSIKNDPFGNGFGYAADFTKTIAVCGHGRAVGCVQKHDVLTETERKIEYQGSLMLGKLMTGFGVLRPECAVELTTA